MKKVKVVAVSGSLRFGSYNRKALKIATNFLKESEAEVVEVDLKTLAVPVYDEDIENKGLPESVNKLKLIIEAGDVILIASPEYNHSIPGSLKNAIDWASRGGNSFKGKVGAVFGASTGRFGTARGQYHLRQVLQGLGVFVVPTPEVFISNAESAFDGDGFLINPKTADLLKQLIKKTLELAINVKNK